MTKWNDRFMQMAELVGSWSKDPEAQVGAVLVSVDRRTVFIGYNGFPRGIMDDFRVNDKIMKNQLMVHAEMNAFHNANTSVEGYTLYVTKPPCVHCTLAIIQEQVGTVIMPRLKEKSSWYLTQKQAVELLTEAGIRIRYKEVPSMTAVLAKAEIVKEIE